MNEQKPHSLPNEDKPALHQEADLLGLGPLFFPTEAEAELLGLAPFQLFESPAVERPTPSTNRQPPEKEG